MIYSVAELAKLFHPGQTIRSFLNDVVTTVKNHMDTDVCSIYLLNESCDQLVLQATIGLNLQMIGTLTLQSSEGLTGLALRESRAVCENQGSANPQFKAIPGSGEEQFEAFLAVPIHRHTNRVGVMVLQDIQAGRYKKDDVKALEAIASQLAATLESAQEIIQSTEINPQSNDAPLSFHLIRGISVGETVAFGRACRMEGPGNSIKFSSNSDTDYQESLEAFQQAINKTEEQLEKLQNHLQEKLTDVVSLIFSAHLLMLKDRGFSGAMEKLIIDGTRPCHAVEQIVNKYIAIFAAQENPHTREKVHDIRDLGHRIMKNLSSDNTDDGDYSRQIVITSELLPSELLKLTTQNVAGIILFGGTLTAHISILAQSLQLPLIFTEDDNLFRIPNDTPLAMDGFQGLLLVNPDEADTKRLSALKRDTEQIQSHQKTARTQTFTKDGKQIHLRAAVNLLSDISLARQLNAEGIGLYRSEFPFLIRNDFLSEEEQYGIYSKIINGMDNDVVNLRTLDIGGDKTLSHIQDEENPSLGLRAIRFLMANEQIFIKQLKAMIRAGGTQRKIRILFPLISSLDDFQKAKEIVCRSLNILQNEGTGTYPMPELGAMIELPSAVEMARELASEADFLSIGTNDLIQYMMGVDRTNECVAAFFDTQHPAVLRAMKKVVDAAGAMNCPLNICGIMAKDARSVYYLIGLGVKEFTMESAAIPEMQDYIARMDSKSAHEDAVKISKLNTLSSVNSYFKKLKVREQAGKRGTYQGPELQDTFNLQSQDRGMGI